MKSDYLKYYNVFRKYVRMKYKIEKPHLLDGLIFIYSEGIFSYKSVDMWRKLNNFHPSTLTYFKENGYVNTVKKRKENLKWFEPDMTLYEISSKGKNVVRYLYDLLEGKRLIADNDRAARLKRVPKSFDSMREYIFKIKRETLRLEQELRHAPEE
jgi:hypothetical protein